MAAIRILPPELASQIAAGEVAERPASVVKELVENALDAQATRCDVEIEGGGILRLSVSDDGHGMDEEDAELAVHRHATSKLASVADLSRVLSYGFRGEALPSIASVSRLSLRSRARGLESGVEVVVEGGSSARLKTVGMAVGTCAEVRDLFFNVPARRKFLRSSATEAGHVTEVVENAALARPDVTFTLTRDGRRVREFLRVSSAAERVHQLFSEPLSACAGERGPLGVQAHLSRPEAARLGATSLHLFVNGRSVRDRAIAATVAHAYGSVIERGRYPRGVVYLSLPPELVDVNVHPQKSEVRFADPRAVTDALHAILSRALTSAFSLPPRGAARVELPLRSRSDAEGPSRPQAARPSSTFAVLQDSEDGPVTLPCSASGGDTGGWLSAPAPTLGVQDGGLISLGPTPKSDWKSLRFIAQLRQTFLLCEGADGIYVIDQHAAAERVTFTRLRRAYDSRAVTSQTLLFPVLVEVTTPEAELVEASPLELARVGLDVRVRAVDSVSIHAVPKLLVRASPERLLRDLLAEVGRKGARAFSDAVDLALATMACHGSLRAGDAVASDEAAALLRSLDEADFAGHCPHGRPVVTFTSWAELERRVGRR